MTTRFIQLIFLGGATRNIMYNRYQLYICIGIQIRLWQIGRISRWNSGCCQISRLVVVGRQISICSRSRLVVFLLLSELTAEWCYFRCKTSMQVMAMSALLVFDYCMRCCVSSAQCTAPLPFCLGWFRWLVAHRSMFM